MTLTIKINRSIVSLSRKKLAHDMLDKKRKTLIDSIAIRQKNPPTINFLPDNCELLLIVYLRFVKNKN